MSERTATVDPWGSTPEEARDVPREDDEFEALENDVYDADDYIREYDEFLGLIGKIQ